MSFSREFRGIGPASLVFSSDDSTTDGGFRLEYTITRAGITCESNIKKHVL